MTVHERDELVWEFVRASDRAAFRCGVRDAGAWGFEAQISRDGVLLMRRQFALRQPAVQWAGEERRVLGRAE
jgi:hypothetical protein